MICGSAEYKLSCRGAQFSAQAGILKPGDFQVSSWHDLLVRQSVKLPLTCSFQLFSVIFASYLPCFLFLLSFDSIGIWDWDRSAGRGLSTSSRLVSSTKFCFPKQVYVCDIEYSDLLLLIVHTDNRSICYDSHVV